MVEIIVYLNFESLLSAPIFIKIKKKHPIPMAIKNTKEKCKRI